MGKLYIVKYCANEYDDLGYDKPHPIYYSLNEENAREFFEKERNKEINHFNDFIKKHPHFKGHEDYQINENEVDSFEYSLGNWFYRYEFEECELEKKI